MERTLFVVVVVLMASLGSCGRAWALFARYAFAAGCYSPYCSLWSVSYIALHCIALHCITLHYTTLHHPEVAELGRALTDELAQRDLVLVRLDHKCREAEPSAEGRLHSEGVGLPLWLQYLVERSNREGMLRAGWKEHRAGVLRAG